MIGGIVIESAEVTVKGEKMWRVWVCDRNGDEAAIYMPREDGIRIQALDKVWWQQKDVYWTSADGEVQDHKLRRTGYSFDPRKGRKTLRHAV